MLSARKSQPTSRNPLCGAGFTQPTKGFSKRKLLRPKQAGAAIRRALASFRLGLFYVRVTDGTYLPGSVQSIHARRARTRSPYLVRVEDECEKASAQTEDPQETHPIKQSRFKEGDFDPRDTCACNRVGWRFSLSHTKHDS